MPDLTRRQKEIINMFAQGLRVNGVPTTPTCQQVGNALGISEKTVDAHLYREGGIYETLGANNQTDAVVKAILTGQIPVDGISPETNEAWRGVLSNPENGEFL